MSTESHDIRSTRAEKLLALILTAFLFLGGLWGYSRLHVEGPDVPPPPALSAADQAGIKRLQRAERAVGVANRVAAQTRSELELRRERYRTALDAGNDAPALAQAYRAADRENDAAVARARRAQAAAADAAAAAVGAFARRNAEADRLAQEYDDDQRRASLETFGLRLALLLTLLALAFALHRRLHLTRYAPVASAVIATTTLLALVGGFDYLDDHVEWQALGPLVLSLVGVALTLLAFVALQRQLARRLPARRVRKGECPTCGYPDRGSSHCEGCGNALRKPCPACGAPRRVGAVHCGACGA